MKVQKTENIMEATTTLVRGEDYEKQWLLDSSADRKLKLLGQSTLASIAIKNGYECCTWSGYEKMALSRLYLERE